MGRICSWRTSPTLENGQIKIEALSQLVQLDVSSLPMLGTYAGLHHSWNAVDLLGCQWLGMSRKSLQQPAQLPTPNNLPSVFMELPCSGPRSHKDSRGTCNWKSQLLLYKSIPEAQQSDNYAHEEESRYPIQGWWTTRRTSFQRRRKLPGERGGTVPPREASCS